MTAIELEAIAGAFASWFTTAEQLVELAARSAPAEQKPAVDATADLLRQVRESLPAWKGTDHGH